MNTTPDTQTNVVASSGAGAPIGVVAIGKNEGERLRRCLESVCGRGTVVVYVDSGSSDGSVELARSQGATVVELDTRTPFTAPRARNEGFARLLELAPNAAYVQFVDGDCELDAAWLERARAELDTHERLAIVCGRRRERSPEASIYNRLCDMEWDTPPGDDTDCGGDALVRVRAFREVGGFDAAMIAGEEPDLCLRLRRRGWTIRRIDAEMTRHDAAMTRARQWWNRAVRTGHAAAEGWARYGRSGEHDHARHVLSALFWSAFLVAGPIAFAASWWLGGASAAWIASGVWFALLCVPFVRARSSRLARGDRPSHATLYGVSCVLGKLPETAGVWRCWSDRRAGHATRWIEYKDQPGAAR